MLPSGSLLPAMARIAVDASSTAMIMSFSAPRLFVFCVDGFGTYYLIVISQTDGPVFVPAHVLQPLTIEGAQILKLLLEFIDTAKVDDMLPDTRVQLNLVGTDNVYLLYLLASEKVVVDKHGQLQQLL